MQSSNWRESLPFRVALLPTMLSAAMVATEQANAQSGGMMLEEVFVSARRQQESLQEVPISITVFNQEQLDSQNIFSSSDLATYTPSLAANNRFGPDQATFAIRGFTQELRTTASVGFYFAEVVAPRGSNSVTAGDGAGPGAFFDLQDVQVLKGPQGTLFGRNTTGGAILVTPQEPTPNLEGYLEASAGDYDMRRLQGVINIPISDSVRARFGVDSMERDGYLKNTSGVGPDRFGDVDYLSARASVIVDINDALQNYTIASYTHSENRGTVSGLFSCKPAGGLFSFGCPAQLANQGDDFYEVQSLTPNPLSELKQWQVINTTTWDVHEALTIKNIVSYASLEQTSKSSMFGINYDYFGAGNLQFTEVNTIPGEPTNTQDTFVEELQFQGYAFDDRLTWQGGLYYEQSKPDGWSSSQSYSQLYCSDLSADPAASQCVDTVRNVLWLGTNFVDVIGMAFGPGGYGAIARQSGKVEYTSRAAYGETSYELTDQFKVTGGLRYTHDTTEARAKSITWNGFPWQGLPSTPGVASQVVCTYANASLADGCHEKLDEQSSEAVTGLINLDYFPTQDVMLYGKYSRGYRQGSINLFGGDGYRAFEPESVNTFEVGAKTKFGGPVPGTLNVAVFYNDLKDQQIMFGATMAGRPPTTAILNAGSSVIQGVEVDATLRLHDDVVLTLGYTYLDTELKEMDVPTDPNIRQTALVGGDLTYSPRHSLVAGLNWLLPVPESVGDVSLGATYTYTDEQFATAPEHLNSQGRLSGTPHALMPSYELLNLNVNWQRIAGSRFDASVFVTNAMNEEYVNYTPGLYHAFGFEARVTGMPRMWGARLRYTFGN